MQHMQTFRIQDYAWFSASCNHAAFTFACQLLAQLFLCIKQMKCTAFNIECMWSAGEMQVILQSITAGGLAAPDAPLASTMLQSPSAQCNQLLRIADLQSVAIREQSFVPEEAASPMHASSSMFLVAKLGYSPGEIQQPTAEGPPAPMQGQDVDTDAQKKAMLRPPGLKVQVCSLTVHCILLLSGAHC